MNGLPDPNYVPTDADQGDQGDQDQADQGDQDNPPDLNNPGFLMDGSPDPAFAPDEDAPPPGGEDPSNNVMQDADGEGYPG